MIVYIWTDGACEPNPGLGGWGALLEYNTVQKQMYGGEAHTTNNRMEVLAAIKALEALKRPCQVILTTDSLYLKDGITVWIHAWIRSGWKRRKVDVKNKDLWVRLYKLTKIHKVEWLWVRGHSGHVQNEIVDRLASKGRKEFIKNLQQ
jgi:ribonuclease HI